MARFLMCWEFGGGLGHAGRFKPLAQELMRRGHEVDLVLRDVVHTRSVLRDLDVRVLQAPLWLHQTVGVPEPTISLAEILMGNGYLLPDTLAGLVGGWQGLMSLTRPDVVITDYAPTAAIAARTHRLPVASVGIGFCMPPDVSPLPPFRTWEPIQPDRVDHYDKLVLGTVNSVLREQGAAPVGKLADIFLGDAALLCTWPELDHYERGPLGPGQRYLGPTFLPSAGEPPVWPEGAGPCVFAYVRSTHPDHVALLQALARTACRTLCYLPEVAAGKAPPVTAPNIRYARGPVNLGQTLRQAQLAICHAGEATLAQAILAGVPVLMLPTQAEQFLLALRVEASGAGVNVATRPRPTPFQPLLNQMLFEPAHREAARALAARYKDFTHEGQTIALVDAFEGLLPAQCEPPSASSSTVSPQPKV